MARLRPRSVCSICSGVKIGRRLASDTFGRSDGSIRLVGITPLKPRRRAANLKMRPGTPSTAWIVASLFRSWRRSRTIAASSSAVMPSSLRLPKRGAEVLLDGAAVAGLGRGAQVEHRAGKPQVSCLAEPEPAFGATASPRPRRASSSSRTLRAAMIPPSTVRQRWMPAASLKPTSSTPVGRR